MTHIVNLTCFYSNAQLAKMNTDNVAPLPGASGAPTGMDVPAATMLARLTIDGQMPNPGLLQQFQQQANAALAENRDSTRAKGARLQLKEQMQMRHASDIRELFLQANTASVDALAANRDAAWAEIQKTHQQADTAVVDPLAANRDAALADIHKNHQQADTAVVDAITANRDAAYIELAKLHEQEIYDFDEEYPL